MILAVFIFYTHTKTVCIRVCGKNKVCIDLLCQLKAKDKGFVRFRIRIAYRWELAVRQLLLRYNIYVVKADLFKDSSGRNITCAVKGCVYDL